MEKNNFIQNESECSLLISSGKKSIKIGEDCYLFKKVDLINYFLKTNDIRSYNLSEGVSSDPISVMDLSNGIIQVYISELDKIVNLDFYSLRNCKWLYPKSSELKEIDPFLSEREFPSSWKVRNKNLLTLYPVSLWDYTFEIIPNEY